MSIAAKTPKPSSAKRVAAHRERMRAAGLVPKTIWVRDTSDPAFRAEFDRQCRAIAANEAHETEIAEWIDKAYEGHDLGPIPPYRLPEEK